MFNDLSIIFWKSKCLHDFISRFSFFLRFFFCLPLLKPILIINSLCLLKLYRRISPVLEELSNVRNGTFIYLFFLFFVIFFFTFYFTHRTKLMHRWNSWKSMWMSLKAWRQRQRSAPCQHSTFTKTARKRAKWLALAKKPLKSSWPNSNKSWKSK